MGNVAATVDAVCGMKKQPRSTSMVRSRSRLASPAVFAVLFIALLVLSTFAQDPGRFAGPLVSGNSEQKRDALLQLRLYNSEAASRIAAAAISDPDELVRATAIGAIGRLPASEVSTLLVPLLSDKAEFIRREAAYTLGEVRSLDAVSPLSLVVAKDKASIVRAAAAAALGKIGSQSGLDALANIFRKRPGSGTEYLRRVAAHSIGEIAEKVRFGTNERGLTQTTPTNFLPQKYKRPVAPTNPEPPVPAFSGALSLLLKAANDRRESADTRREIAFALGAIGDPSAIKFLNANASSPDVYLAEICKEALLKIRIGQ